MDKKTCETCGAIYQITTFHVAMRDNDSIKCKYCGTELISWNGSNIYSEKEISGPTKEYKV